MRVLPTVSVEHMDREPSMTIDEARQRIQKLASTMDPAQRRHVAKEMTAGLLKIERDTRNSKQAAEARQASIHDFQQWIQAPALLEKNDCSRLHRLVDAANAGMIINKDGDSDHVDPRWMHGNFQTFVIQHNWAAAFESAEGIDDTWRMPYDLCAFEFRISGRNCIVAAAQSEDTMKATLFVEFGQHWLNPDSAIPAYVLMFQHVRAICIAVDAEVATTEVVRAPHKLNEKRAKAGKTPLPDYRVVDLARRHRVSNPSAAPGTGTRKRLHFRRGHWRHYETSKTWVKWCLVGNPDLGFINKHYRL